MSRGDWCNGNGIARSKLFSLTKKKVGSNGEDGTVKYKNSFLFYSIFFGGGVVGWDVGSCSN